MKKTFYQIINHTAFRNILIFLLVITLTVGAFPLRTNDSNVTEYIGVGLTASAADNTADDPNFVHDTNNNNRIDVNLDNLVLYSQAYQQYPVYHQHDAIYINTSGSTALTLDGFRSLGTEEHPFAGSIQFQSFDNGEIFLDVPLFNVVYDTATVNNERWIQISRVKTQQSDEATKYKPLIANKVEYDSESSHTKAVWRIKAVTYSKESENKRLEPFAGFIGTMTENAQLTLDTQLDFTGSRNTSIEMESNANDIGVACGKMENSSQLTFSLGVTAGASGGAVTKVSSTSGHAGGFVGSMDNGASFTLTALTEHTPLFGTAAQITTTGADKYAGGIVGSNTLGTVTFPNTAYTVNQIISGKAGAGGVFGYYQPPADVTMLNTSQYSISHCQLNGEGETGGYFGFLENNNPSFSITGSVTVTTSHTEGSVNSYGGLIGKYKTNELSNTLTITSVTTNMTRDTSAAATYYGGGIGIVDGSAYVKFDAFTVAQAANAEANTFGGAAASAEKGYIDVAGLSYTNDVTYHGGGVVGKLGNGVLRMSGTINLTNAKPSDGGQIVNTCDNALVYAKDWTFTRSAAEFDNIASWGDVLVFDSTHLNFASVLTENAAAHTITITAPAAIINSKEEFAKTALGLQINYSNNDIVSGTAVVNTTPLTFSGTIDLTGTGLKGLTRDNTATDRVSASHCVYKGTITGGGAAITLDIQNVGNKPIYRHKYNGLIGIADDATIQNLTMEGNVNLKAKAAMYAGAIASRATNNFTAQGIDCSTVFTANGGEKIYLGRLLGEASASIGTITICKATGNILNTFSGNITGANSSVDTCLGGVIGRISHNANAARTWRISDVTLSGTIANTASKATQRIGGLIAEIAPYSNTTPDTPSSYNSRSLTLQNITVNSLSVSATLGDKGTTYSSGGLLGYSWLSTDVTIGAIVNAAGANGVSVTSGTVGCNSSKTGYGDTGGLVWQATGKWTVNDVEISSITLNGSAKGIRSFGVLVDKGWYADESYYSHNSRQALYLLLPASHTYTIGTNNFSNVTITDFDELLTYSAYYEMAENSTDRTCSDRGSGDGAVSDIMVNGQAIVSYNNGQTGGGLKMEETAENSLTYTAKTERGRTVNPYSRYYYNLDTIGTSANAAKLLQWGVYVYACANIKQHFTNSFGGSLSNSIYTGGTITNVTYDMKGYSWYPIDIDGSVTVNGTFKFYNKEFEGCEGIKNNSDSTKPQMLSLPEGANASQHYMLHNGLFHDVTGSLNVGNITLQGNVGATSLGSGALVCGIVKGDVESRAKIALASGNNISLDGVYVHNISAHSSYAPLLINKSGSYTSMKIHHVSTTSAYHNNNRYSAATSLVGKAGNGDPNSQNVNVEFQYIALDGRSAAGTHSIDLSVYNTTHSIFTRATLMESFMWSSGSKGTYNYNYGEDWNGSTHLGQVTYGSEISDSTTRNQYYGEEFWYKDQDQAARTNGTAYFTDYSNSNHTGTVTNNTAPVSFSQFRPYVYDVSTESNVKTQKKYQLEVNHATATMTGCGTYNDPYVVTDRCFELIATILSGIGDGTINLPVIAGYNAATLSNTKWHDGTAGCEPYTWDAASDKFVNSSNQGYTLNAVRKYLAGAYYVIKNDITLSKRFIGLGAVSDTTDADQSSVFRGVIVGQGSSGIVTVTNQSDKPLILSSYGCVVKDVNVLVDTDIAIEKKNTNKLSYNVTEGFYGAVIGQIFGGDNILDGVTVHFNTGKNITLKGSKAHLIPVGGYVGVIENGGLLFRGMEKSGAVLRGTDDIKGIPSNVVKNGSDTSLVEETSTKWLYVNPIIGRVLNGYAVTEAAAYRPYEDGTRTYSDGSREYWQSNGTVSSKTKAELAADNTLDTTMKASAAAVTMRNGSKHYSITDINKSDTNSFNMSGIADGSDITVSSAQALFIMSLITQSGLGKSSTGHYSQTNKAVAANPEQNYLTPYNSYMATHLADYSYVKDSSLTGSAPTAASTAAQTDYLKAAGDTYAGHGTDKLPYLIKTYTNTVTVNHETVYPAFDAAGDYTHFFNLILSGNNSTFYLPDSYRGLGALMFGQTLSSNLDDYKENVIFLYSFDGGTNNAVSLNMKLLLYHNDNYNPLTGNQACFKTGFGFIDCLQSAARADGTANPFKNLTIQGNLKYELINSSTGQHVDYSQTYISNGNRKSNVAAAAFIGVPVASKASNPPVYNIDFENIILDSMDIYGICYAGGFVGAYNVGGQLSFKKCGADDLKVFAGGAAGGLMGYMRNGSAKVKADFEGNDFGIISIISAFKPTDSSAVGDGGQAAAGGLIGDRKSSFTADSQNITISNVNICNGTSLQREGKGGYIGYYEDGLTENSKSNPNIPAAGGVIGSAGRTTLMEADTVTVKNLNICGAYAGGMVGQIPDETSGFTIKNSQVITDTSTPCRIESTYYDSSQNTSGSYNNVTYAGGGFIGYDLAPVNAVITDSKLISYHIAGYYNTGGVIGKYSAGSNAKAVITNVELNGHHLKGYYNVGGLVGSLNGNNKREINGYNILIKNQSSESYSADPILNNGFIVGFNNKQLIKIAGFSRQGSINTAQMIGNNASVQANSTRYGGNGNDVLSRGYVIFADYNDAGTSEHNDKFANMDVTPTNVVEKMPVGSVTTVTTYTIISHEENGQTVIDDTSSSSTRTPGNQIITVNNVPLAQGEVQTVSSGVAYQYGTVSDHAESINDLDSQRAAGGFYIYLEDIKNGANQQRKGPYYLTASMDSVNGGLRETNEVDYNASDSKAIWYFEKAGSYYKIYTQEGQANKYIHTKANRMIELSSSASDLFEIEDVANNIFHFKKKSSSDSNSNNNGSYLQHSAGGTVTRYYGGQPASGDEYNYEFKLKFVQAATPSLVCLTYSDMTCDEDTQAVSFTAAPTTGTATAEQTASYTASLAGYDTSAHSYKVCVVTKTVTENTYDYNLNKSPYVTTSPKTDVTNTQWLTGDGMKSDVFAAINTDRTDNTKPKRYQTANTSIGAYDTSRITGGFSDAYSEFGSSYGGENFHILVLEDTDPTAVTNLIVNYLRLLTNTNYEFANKIYDYQNVSNESKVPFKVVRKQFVYQNNVFQGNNVPPNLQYSSTTGEFFMRANAIDSDAANPQFTLLDVQFFDPSDTSPSNRKIAYHLYVPVYTRKIIQFSFDAKIVSGTYYYPDPYVSSALFENLGTPVTLRLSYSYGRRTNAEWINAINGGENVMGNYYKSLNLTNETGTWKAGTKLVLVDSSNNGKVYYYDHFNSANATTDLSIDFKNFKDDNDVPYAPVPLYELLNVVVAEVNTGAALVELKDGDDTATATVYYNGKYYKPNPGTEYTRVSYTAEDTKYAVTNVSPQNENYYLSIFTPKVSANEPIHHFAFTSPDTMLEKTVDAVPKSKLYGASPKIDYYTGDLYEITFDSFTTNNGSGADKMTDEYNYLSVNMTTTIEWTQAAKTQGGGAIFRNLANAQDASIFQTFLMTYSMKTDVNSASKVGIQPGSHPEVGIVSYTINNTPVQQISGSDQKINQNLNYIEFANGVNLKQYLERSINETAVIAMSGIIEYDSNNLSIQFPPKQEGDTTTIGTTAIAYSKVASSVEAVRNSPNQEERQDTHLYYTDTLMPATLKYTLDFTKSRVAPAGLYNDLGINSFDKDNDVADSNKNSEIIYTNARYDTSNINRSDEFIELTIRLYTRELNGSGYSSNSLLLNSYFHDVKVYGSDDITDLMAQASSEDIVVTKDQTEYKLRVKKTLLKTEPENDKIYLFPITLDVKTGNTLFNTSGLMYANYKVVVSAALYDSTNNSTTALASDHLIYTNARMDSSMQP